MVKNEVIEKLEKDTQFGSNRDKITNNIKLALHYIQSDPEKSKNLAEEASVLAHKLQDNWAIAESNRIKGIHLYHKSEYNPAISLLQNSLSIFTELHDQKGIANSLHNLANVQKSIGNFDDALKNHLAALTIQESFDDQLALANTYNSIGIIYWNLNQDDKALNYYEKALQIAENFEEKKLMASIYNNIGIIYRRKDKIDKALEFYLQSLEIKKKLDDRLSLANSYQNIGVIYITKEQFNHALEYTSKAESLMNEIGNKEGEIRAQLNIGYIYQSIQEYTKAENILIQVKKDIDSISSINLEMICCDYLSSLYENQKKFEKALYYNRCYHRLEKKLFNEKQKKKIEEIQSQYELEKKEKESLNYRLQMIELQKEVKKFKHIETMLHERQDFYRFLVDNSHEGVLIFDQDFHVIYANKKLSEILNVKIDSFIGKDFRSLLDEKSRQIITQYNLLRQSGKSVPEQYELPVQINQSNSMILHIITRLWRDRKDTKTIAHIIDITKQQQVSSDLIQNERKHRIIVDAISNPLVAFTKKGDITFCNTSFALLLNKKISDIQQHNIFTVLPDLQEINSFSTLDETIKDEKVIEFECFLLDHHWNVTVHPTSWGILTSFEDISKQKKVEKQLKELVSELQKTIASKDKFFSIIAHDLKSPFATMTSFINLMKQYYDSLDKRKIFSMVKELEQSQKNSFELLQNLLSWSRMQSGLMKYHPIDYDLYYVVEKLISMNQQKAEQKNIRINNTLQPGLFIYSDSYMIQTTLRNLVTNAIKFTAEKGKITLHAKDYDEDFYEIIVEDTGIGIPQKDINKLFKVETTYSTFGTKNEKGTGLGLVLCRDFVEKNGGEIWVTSEEGHGSSFHFTVMKFRKS